MRVGLFLCLMLWLAGVSVAEDASPLAPKTPTIPDALDSGLKLVRKGAGNYPNHRQCFSCHHQTLPLQAAWAVELNPDNDLADSEWRKAVVDFTVQSFRKQQKQLHEGRSVGGSALTVTYGLWALELADYPADDLTNDMIGWLLKTQQERGHWRAPSSRPPMSEGHITPTVLALRAFRHYGTKEQQPEIAAAQEKAVAWLKSTELKSHEDRVFLFWASPFLNDKELVDRLQREIVQAQRADGGWAQREGMESDAYATGQTLFVLQDVERDTDHEVLWKAVKFLLDSQLSDGSWYVETRAKPVQVYFDNGDPHGKSQFISVAGTSWAVSALGMYSWRAWSPSRPPVLDPVEAPRPQL